MFRIVILILAFVQLQLAEGVETRKQAGNKTENSPRRILHGTQVRPKDFPYLVRLKLLTKKAVCGGSIIANHWIMTAAHCVRGEACGSIKIVPTAWKKRQNIRPVQCYIHEQNIPGEYEYDIALLRLDADILQDGRAKTISLPPPGSVYPPGTPVVVLGYGMTEKQEFPSTLLKGDVRVEDWETCNKKYLNNHEKGTKDMPIRTLCVQGNGAKPSGTCIGDSGGPGVTSGDIVIGIASVVLKKNGFCMIGGPSMLVSVTDYLPWIHKHVNPSLDTSQYVVRPEHILT